MAIRNDAIPVILVDGDNVVYTAGAAVGGATSALQTAGNDALADVLAELVDVSAALTTLNTVSALPASSTRISTSTTTLVKSGAGRLHLVTVGALGTVSSSVTVYDSLTGSGTVLAVINSLTLSGSFTYNLPFATGLTVVTTGTVAPDVVVVWS